MTPFGRKMRQLRTDKNVTQKQQAHYLGVSKAYISALENGARGKPSVAFVDQICVWLGLIWDDAEELKRLASLSHPKPTINVRKQTPDGVLLANMLAQNIERLDDEDCQILLTTLEKRLT